MRSSHFLLLSTLRRPNMQNIRTWNQGGSKIYVDIQHGVYHYKCNKSFKVSYAKRNNYCMSAHCLKLYCLQFYFQSWCLSCLASESRVVLNGSSSKKHKGQDGLVGPRKGESNKRASARRRGNGRGRAINHTYTLTQTFPTFPTFNSIPFYSQICIEIELRVLTPNLRVGKQRLHCLLLHEGSRCCSSSRSWNLKGTAN